MKVVLFCGGLGTRIREHSERVPKPLVDIGARPIIWHLMKYYAHYGHKDFILCLGHGAVAIKEFFLNYDARVSSDFVLQNGGELKLLERDFEDWKITFVDTGLHSNVGERLRRIRQHLEGEEMFLANYSDGLTDLDLDAYVQAFRKRGKTACFVSVSAPHTFHIVHSDADQLAFKLEHVTESNVRINGGFFAFRQEIFDVLLPDEELVVEPFRRLMEMKQLVAVPHDGFWRNMDTFKDKLQLDEILARGRAPWQVWQK